jgi:ubiquitin C-terminal hydrolase
MENSQKNNIINNQNSINNPIDNTKNNNPMNNQMGMNNPMDNNNQMSNPINNQMGINNPQDNNQQQMNMSNQIMNNMNNVNMMNPLQNNFQDNQMNMQNNLQNNPHNQMNPSQMGQINQFPNNQVNQGNNLKPNTKMILGNDNNMNNNINPNINMNIPVNQQVPNENVPYSFSRYKKASRTTLINLDDTSYLNSVLQFLATSKSFSNYFVNPKNIKYFIDNMNSVPLAFVFYRFFSHVYPYPETNEQERYNPETLLKVLGVLNKIYDSKRRRNPNDLVLFILNFLHKELNLIHTHYLTCDSYTDKQQAINDFLGNYNKSNKSIISFNFIWFEIKSEKCTQCNIEFYSLKSYETLELDLSNYYTKNYNMPLTIAKCLEFQGYGQQKFFCKNCNNYCISNISTKIYSTPYYLVFSLNRENANNLVKVPFFVEEKIELRNFIEFNQSFSKYELQAVVSISLKENNKYVCFGKSPVDQVWYLYNDEKCADGNINTVLNLNNNNQGYVPCILLYKALKNQ